MPLNKQRILVVEDEVIVAADIQQRLRALGYEVPGTATTGAEAVQMALELQPDLVLMDIVLQGDMDGVSAAELIRQHLDIPVVYLTAHSDERTFQRAKLSDPYGYVVKPFEERTLQVAIELAPHRYAMDRRLRQINHWVTATLHSIGEGVVATSTRGEVLFLNPAAERLTGWTHTEASGKPIYEVVQFIHEQTQQPIEHPARRALQEKVAVPLTEDVLLVSKSGAQTPVDDSAAPIVDEGGKMLGVVIVFRDVTLRKSAERRILQLDQEVRRLMAEAAQPGIKQDDLEALATAISHDLRAPLRAIGGFSEMLAADCHDKLDETGQRFLGLIQTSARTMGQMLEGYLAFLGVSRREMNSFQPIDMQQLVQEVFEQLNATLSEPQAILVRRPMPNAWGDPWMVRQVWVNLISNALKYSARRSQPRLEVGGNTDGDRIIYYVRDNGVGFNPGHAHKLFEAFRRLQGANDFPGTGVGLAIVKRIVERHGGRVWADSQPDQGATFYFALPSGPPTPAPLP